MQYIYIEDYIRLSKEYKIKFLNFMNRCTDFKVSNQKIILSEEALILGFSEGSDIQKAYINFKNFFIFQDLKHIKVDIIQKTFDKSNNMILTFNDTNKQIRV